MVHIDRGREIPVLLVQIPALNTSGLGLKLEPDVNRGNYSCQQFTWRNLSRQVKGEILRTGSRKGWLSLDQYPKSDLLRIPGPKGKLFLRQSLTMTAHPSVSGFPRRTEKYPESL